MRGELAALLAAAMQRKGWREADLVRASGVEQSRVNRLLSGATRRVDASFLRSLCTPLGVPFREAVEAHLRDLRRVLLRDEPESPEDMSRPVTRAEFDAVVRIVRAVAAKTGVPHDGT